MHPKKYSMSMFASKDHLIDQLRKDYDALERASLMDGQTQGDLSQEASYYNYLDAKNEELEEENEKLKESVSEWKKACTMGMGKLKAELVEEKRKHEETKKQLTVHRDMYHTAMRSE